MHPQKYKFLRRFELVWLCHKQPLEDVAEMPDVELVVEVRCCLSEIGGHLFNPVNAVLFVYVVFEGRAPQSSSLWNFTVSHTPSFDVVPRCMKTRCHLPSTNIRGAHLTVKPERSFDHIA